MRKHLLLFASLALLLSAPAEATHVWRKAPAGTTSSAFFAPKANVPRAVSPTTTELPATNAFGAINGPDGTVWTYTMDYTVANGSYTSAHVKVYNSKQVLVGEFTDTFENYPGETGVNSVQLNPTITKKFFNLDDNYEVMLFIHATTEDYSGHNYNDVFSLGKPDKIATIGGNQVLAQNTARDAWSENYTLLFQRDSIDYDTYEYHMYYDVYEKASYNGGIKKIHTFDIDYDYISGSGNAAVPIMMQKRNNQIYYALPRYEKPFFDPNTSFNEDPVVTPDNNLLITLLNSRFDTLSVTKIPCPTETDYIYTFPYVGGLRSNDDFAFDEFAAADTAFIVSFDHYTTTDEFLTSYYVYNVQGELIKTIAKYSSDALWLSDIPGQEEQYCFLFTNDDAAWFSFVDVPSCNEVLRLPAALDGNSLSTNLDRYQVGNSYQYVFSLSYAADDAEGNTIHSIAWINQDGSLNHYDRLNLGQNIQMANPWISAQALNPWVFNTDNEREYMVLVKRLKATGSPATDELLYVVNTKGERLLEIGPDETKGNLSGISLLNPESNPTLAILYYNSGAASYYTPTFVALPLNTFAGSGTTADPYQIATAGDFKRISTAPAAAFQVVADIDFQSLPFGGIDANFTGSIDGQDHVLTNLVLEDNGLFHNVLENASIRDLHLYKPQMSLEDASEAGFIANSAVTNQLLKGTCVIENVHIYQPVVSAAKDFDGYFCSIAGSTATGTQILQCSANDADIQILSEDATAGGIVGTLRTGSSVKACAFSGELIAGIAGGIAGENLSADETISHCHSNADITGYSAAGGIIGYDARATVSNCLAEGNIDVFGGIRTTAAGGIAGTLEETWETPAAKVIENCLVGISSIHYWDDAKGVAAHRIVGYTSADKQDGDSQSAPETALANNYVISALAVLDESVQATDTTTEGATLPAADLTTDFLAAHNFAEGTSLDAPWVHSATPYLWFEKETGALISDQTEIDLVIGDSAEVTFSILNGDGTQIQVSCNDPNIVWNTTAAEGYYTTTRVKAVACGTATLTATYGDKTATVTVLCHYQYIGYDSEKGSINQKYTDADNIALEDYRETQGFVLFAAEKADGSDKVLFYIFNDSIDENIVIPAGTYAINSTYNDYTVLASVGINTDGILTPSYYTTLNGSTPIGIWFFVDGTVEIGNLGNGQMSLTANAVNSYNLPVHIEYTGTPTAIEYVAAEEESETCKLIESGILYIIRNGHTYTATGELVK